MVPARKRTTPEATAPRVDEASLLDDWLGLAGYLAEAIGTNDVTLETARAELAGAATGGAERRALARAAETATIQLGETSTIASLLRWATAHAGPAAEVA
jgi:hypothetical protein